MSVKTYKEIKYQIQMTQTAHYMATKWKIRKTKIAQTINIGETVEKEKNIFVSTRKNLKITYCKTNEIILILGVRRIQTETLSHGGCDHD